ncbi:hypothetical protein T265_00162 [Opisthorchis viverrini]|uniref:Uncharacterized protein n=1 Tax=Opisthorchis viverrini TaxID=6198 RepID=A0A075A4L8_OPIVI|nr:hypothetical protein T265_00162 [Opisthorchis viverrini]KER34321.1 hypothetical protein T265_00162 [Opisthorchis viverrini]
MAQWLKRRFTDRKVRCSSPTSASQPSIFGSANAKLLLTLIKSAHHKRHLLPPISQLSMIGGEMDQVVRARPEGPWFEPDLCHSTSLPRLGQRGSIPALVPPSCGMAARHRKGATAKRFFSRLLDDGTEDRLLLAQMALDLERDVFEAEKNIFSIATKELIDVNGVPSECKHNTSDSRVSSSSPLPDTVDSSVPEHPLPVHRKKLPDPVYLKHSSSALPPPWSTLLGPLAYLRPLEFSPDGSTRFATINFPELPNESLKSASGFCSGLNLERLNGISDHLPTNNATVIYPSERCLPNSLGDNIDRNEDSSDEAEAEADALLGLDTRQSRTKSTEHLVTTNGLLDGRVGSSLAGPSLDQDESVAFDETYDLWQELMRDEGMDIEEMESETLHACLESNSDSLTPPVSENCVYFSVYLEPSLQGKFEIPRECFANLTGINETHHILLGR